MKTSFLTFIFLLAFSLSYSQIKITSAGDVGIGHDSPLTDLDVRGSGANMGFRVQRTDFDAYALFHNTDGNPQMRLYRVAKQFAVGNRAGRLHLQPQANVSTSGTGLHVDETGNVGVGIFAPSYLLHVNGNAAKPGGGSWTNASDKRLKKNIKPLDMGLEDILSIDPVYFTYNGKGGIKDTETEFVGVIAQDYVKVVPHAKRDFVHKNIKELKNASGDLIDEEVKLEEYLAVDPSSLPFILVNAIKDQHDIISDLQAEVAQLRELVEKQQLTNQTTQKISLNGSTESFLGQNTPNPYSSMTRISYALPQDADRGEIHFFNLNGELIKKVDLDGKVGTVEVFAEDISSGVYSYSLIVDNTRIDTKKMILQK